METGFREQIMQNKWPSADIYEYLLVVQPDAGVRAQVMEEKYFFNGQYRPGAKDSSPPDIAIASFTAKEAMEEIMIRWLRRIIGQQPGFTVTLNNYSGIPAHAVYLRVQEQEPFRQLAGSMGAISEFLADNHCPPLQLHQRPYIALASGLSPAVYEKAMPYYSQRSFHASFAVQQLVLIRKNGEGICRRVQAFGLLPAEKDQFVA
jgi:hypothetical protein